MERKFKGKVFLDFLDFEGLKNIHEFAQQLLRDFLQSKKQEIFSLDSNATFLSHVSGNKLSLLYFFSDPDIVKKNGRVFNS